MSNRILNKLYIAGINLFLALFLSVSVFLLFTIGMKGIYGNLFILLFVIALLPILNHFQKMLTTKIIAEDSDDPFVQAVDSIINIEQFDEMLKKTFDRIINMMNAGSGRVFLYNNVKNEFELFYQKAGKGVFFSEGGIEGNSVLLEGIKGPNDILIKGWLDQLNRQDRDLIEELQRLDCEIVVPIYYQKIFLGLILIGGKKRYSESEVRILRIFASQIATNVQNTFYFSNILQKKEMEKEYELTGRIQKQFMTSPNLRSARITVETYYKAAPSPTREFYDIFAVDPDASDIRISAYRIHGDIKEISILIPGVKALLQCFARLKYSPGRAVAVLAKIGTEKDVLIGDFSIFHSSITQDGSFTYFNTGYPPPFVYRKSTSGLSNLPEVRRGAGESIITLNPGDITIIACKEFSRLILIDMDQYRDILEKNYSAPIEEMKKSFVERLSCSVEEMKEFGEKDAEAEDRLLILVKVEECA